MSKIHKYCFKFGKVNFSEPNVNSRLNSSRKRGGSKNFFFLICHNVVKAKKIVRGIYLKQEMSE